MRKWPATFSWWSSHASSIAVAKRHRPGFAFYVGFGTPHRQLAYEVTSAAGSCEGVGNDAVEAVARIPGGEGPDSPPPTAGAHSGPHLPTPGCGAPAQSK